jgi:hypothetical protein
MMENHEYKRFEAHAMRGGGWALFGVDYLNGLHRVADIAEDWAGYSCRIGKRLYKSNSLRGVEVAVKHGEKGHPHTS